MKTKTVTITVATVALVAMAAAAALLALSSVARAHQTCGKVKPTELRAAADPNYGANLEKLARCGS